MYSNNKLRKTPRAGILLRDVQRATHQCGLSRDTQEPLQTRINLYDPLSVYIPSSMFLRSSVYHRVTYRDLGSDNTWLKSVVPFSTPVISGNPDFSNSIYPITDDTHRRETAVVHFRWTSGSLKYQPRDH